MVMAIEGFDNRFRQWSESGSDRKYSSRFREYAKNAVLMWARFPFATVAIEQSFVPAMTLKTFVRIRRSDTRRRIRSTVIAVSHPIFRQNDCSCAGLPWFAWMTEDTSGQTPRGPPFLDRGPSVHQHPVDSLREIVRVVFERICVWPQVRRTVPHAWQVEDDEVGGESRLDQAAIGEAEARCGHPCHFVDGTF